MKDFISVKLIQQLYTERKWISIRNNIKELYAKNYEKKISKKG